MDLFIVNIRLKICASLSQVIRRTTASCQCLTDLKDLILIIYVEVEINFLMQQALSSVSTLPFHLVMDTWRWKLFAGQIPDAKQWNAEFWKEK